MKTFILLLFYFSFSFLAFSQNSPQLEKKFFGITQFSSHLGFEILNNYSIPNNFDKHILIKPQLKNQIIHNVNTLEQKLDSSLFVDFDGVVLEKDLYKYDSNGNFIERIWYININEGLIKYRRYTLSYDEFGNLLKNVEYGWNDSLNSWITRYSTEYSYSGNLLINAVYWRWQDGKIDFNSKMEYSYNNNQKVIERRHYEAVRNNNVAVWEYQSVDSIHYNSLNQVIEVVSHMVNPILKPFWRIAYQYDEKGDLTNWNAYYWNEDQNSWYNGGVREFSYDAKRNLTQALIYFWDTEIEELFGVAKYEFLYDENNNILTFKEFDFNRDNKEWIQNVLISFQYSDAGNVLDFKRYERGNNGNFDLTEIISLEYDETIPTETIAWPGNTNEPFLIIDNDVTYLSVSIGNIKFNHKPIKAVLWYPDKGTVVYAGESRLYYSSFKTTGISDIKNSDFFIFPNPATESITFNWQKKTETMYLEIFNINGQKVLNKTIYNNTPESIIKLIKGIYLFRLSDNGEIAFTGKLRIN